VAVNPRAASQQLSRATCRSSPTVDRGVYPRSRNSSRYASANGASGPGINTLLILLVGLAIHSSSFSGNTPGKDDHNHSRYADINPANITTCADFLASVGITTGSA